MKIITTIAFLQTFFISSILIAQVPPDIDWSAAYGGTAADNAYGLVSTSDGGYIICGGSSSVNGDVTGNNGAMDFWVAKLTSNGVIEWQKSLGGSLNETARSIIQTSDGNYVVFGYSGSSNGDVSSNQGLNDYWLVKLDGTGSILWEESVGGSGQDYGICIRETSDGGFITCGNSQSNDGDVSSNAGGRDVWVTKHNSSGVLQWENSLGGSMDDAAQTIEETSDGGFILSGNTQSNDGDVVGYHGGYDSWIVKLNSSGGLEWQRCSGGTGDDFSYSIIETSDGGFAAASHSNSDDGDLASNMGDYDLWLIKLSSSGSLDWHATYGGTNAEYGYDVIEAQGGGYLLSGSSDSNDGDVTGNHGDLDSWIIKTDDQGILEWQRSCGGGAVERAFVVLQLNDGSIVIAGPSSSDDGDLVGTNGNFDYWVLKLEPDPVGIISNKPETFSIAPNPTSDNIVLTLDKVSPRTVVEVSNASGNVIISSQLNALRNTISLEALSNGVYVITLITEDGKVSKPVIKR